MDRRELRPGASRAWGRLLRLSLAPSAAADVAAGLVLGGFGAWPGGAAPWLLLAASLCVYHGGMALNDWADREADVRTRPDRPIPSGAIPPRAALAAGLGLELAGIALAWLASPRAGLWVLAIAALAVSYDLAGRGPLRGPLLLGACRALNLGLGVYFPGLLASQPVSAAPAGGWIPCALYGLYVVFASRLARLEDEEDPRPLGSRPRRALLLAAGALVCLPFVDPYGPGLAFSPLAGAIAWIAAFGLASAALGTREWSRAAVGRASGLALRRLLAFTAACAALADPLRTSAWIVAAAILCGYPLSWRLRRVFPPT
ncbi:MAG TPA: UbiA family prenyltransferase [Planctomycetota bacterium]|nr:UbiA family prenyltransferase [Planctomycetota bacterium]